MAQFKRENLLLDPRKAQIGLTDTRSAPSDGRVAKAAGAQQQHPYIKRPMFVTTYNLLSFSFSFWNRGTICLNNI